MNVKDVLSVLKEARKFTIMYGDNFVDFANGDEMMINAFGKYKVDHIHSVDGGDNYYEIHLAMRPVVSEEN